MNKAADDSKHAKDLKARADIAAVVEGVVASAPIRDIHTHLYAPAFEKLLLWGIDELLTYHYLLAEFFRACPDDLTYDHFWSLPKSKQAELVWQHLFIEQSPISSAARGVITCLARLGLDPDERDLTKHRKFFAKTKLEEQIDRVLEISGVRDAIMTNDPFDPVERNLWQAGVTTDARFHAALRLDPLLLAWDQSGALLKAWGYNVVPDLSGATFAETRRFLEDCIKQMHPVYMAVSLPPEFQYPSETPTGRLLEMCVLPVAREHALPLALMIGVKRQVNPALRLAGDASGATDLIALSNLCAAFPQNRFLCTVLARENQHQLAVIARKFRNLHLFGCWWFLNVPSLTEEITRMRIELLGHGFTPQHSDARVLEQLISKWQDTRIMLARVLTDVYSNLAAAGRTLAPAQIRTEIEGYFGGNAWDFLR